MLDAFKKLTDKGIIVVNITQCSTGSVEMQRYETGIQLLQAGLLNGYDATIEASVTKLMYLLGQDYDNDTIIKYMNTSIAGEITVD